MNTNTQTNVLSTHENMHNTFSPVIAKGALNHCSKVLQDLNIDGSKKFSKAHNSGRLFYSVKHEQYTVQYTLLNAHM